MEQYQYVEGFQRFHTDLRLRCAACLSLQFSLFEYIHYDIHKYYNGTGAFDIKTHFQASETQRY